MRYAVLLAGIVVVTAFVFTLTTGKGVASSEVLGLPILCVETLDEACWLAWGSGGRGVLVVAAGGLGVVSLTIYGAGVLFASGQLALGGIVLGQAGFGLSFSLSQLAVAFAARGQLAIGVIVEGQGQLGIDGTDFFAQTADELTELIKPFGSKP